MRIINFIKQMRETPIGGSLISVIFYAVITILGVKLSDKITNRLSGKFSGKVALHWKFMKQVNRVVLITIGLLGLASSIPALDKFSTAIITSSSVVVAAVGLASQESLSNAINGMFITVFKPFVVGDRIRLNNLGLVGFVEDINLRHTVIRTFENNRIMIPNTTLNKENIENYNYVDKRVCNYIDVSVQYSSDLDKAIIIFEEVITSHPLFLDTRTKEDLENGKRAVNIFVRNLTEFGIELRVGVWAKDINDSFVLGSDIKKSVVKRFKEEGIEIGIPNVKVV